MLALLLEVRRLVPMPGTQGPAGKRLDVSVSPVRDSAAGELPNSLEGSTVTGCTGTSLVNGATHE